MDFEFCSVMPGCVAAVAAYRVLNKSLCTPASLPKSPLSPRVTGGLASPRVRPTIHPCLPHGLVFAYATYVSASLDERIDLIERTGGEPVITLCTAPGWMKGTDDWNMDAAPTPEHYDD